MRFLHMLVVTSWSVLIFGLVAAYASAGVGLAGLVDVRKASLAVIVAMVIALSALITHYLAAMRELQDPTGRFKLSR